jgi:signal transduction histidine kinase
MVRFSSLRARLALTFAFVVAISLLVAAVSLTALLRGYSNRLVQERLDDVAMVVLIQARGMLARGETPAQVIEFLSEQAERLQVRILLLDRQSIVSRDVGQGPSLRGMRIPIEPEAPLRIGRQPLHGRFSAPHGVVYQYSGLPIANRPLAGAEPWLVLVMQPEGSLLATLGSLLPRLALAAGAGLLVGLLAAILLARWLGQPLGRLLAATQAMARGDYSQRVPPAGPRELARLSEGFNAMAAEVERSRQIVHSFVSTLSHELRTPLTSIRGFAQAVLDGSASSPETVERAMQIVDSEARRMQRLSTELLDLSRLQAGQIPMRQETVELGALIRQCADVLAGNAQQRHVEVELDLPTSLSVQGDTDRLEQIFTNLLDNAIKFSPAGASVQVSGALRNGEASAPDAETRLRRGVTERLSPRPPVPASPRQPGRFAVVEIANSGSSIPAEELPRIFEQFYSGREGRERGGTGLGLPIAREIARAHGGDITVSSQDALTTFRVLLPA